MVAWKDDEKTKTLMEFEVGRTYGFGGTWEKNRATFPRQISLSISFRFSFHVGILLGAARRRRCRSQRLRAADFLSYFILFDRRI
ncbi:hypothetical protein EUGRSUZ_K01708 [Eucalyptus grandis]|uniref:Uncharacterized protein n=2 Tax=Eucalyptus grandis TaxID=71139 RepID=A0ACC3IU37_EUCGR|nr:hypothetical protein EUGRSUZ_K01708 [Eucalyptus grandis]